MASVSLSGKYKNSKGNYVWHTLGESGNTDGLGISGTLTISGNTLSGSVTSTLYNNSGKGKYGYPITIGIISGGSLTTVSKAASDTSNKYVTGGVEKSATTLVDASANGSGTKTISLSYGDATRYLLCMCKVPVKMVDVL